MEPVQIFLNINKPGLNNEWNKKITSLLEGYPGVSSVLIVEKNESEEAQININYEVEKASFDEIELLLKDSGTALIKINIHFPSGISGVTDAYGASAISLTLDKSINKINGVLGVSISSSGTIKAELDPAIADKTSRIKRIVACIFLLRTGNS